MVKFLYDENIILYSFAALFGLGMLVRLLLDLVYRYLIKDSDHPGTTKNKLIRHMKLKFETCFKYKIGVNNVDTFVDKNVLQYRFCGVLLSTWENLSGQVLYLSLLLVPIFVLFGVIYDCGQKRVLLNGAVGILTCALLILVDKSINLQTKKRMLRLNIMDYLENFYKTRLEKEALHPELVEEIRREFMQVTESKKQAGAAKEIHKEEAKEELNRRKEARRKKEEERRLLAQKREEEQRKLEEARREEERRRLEERRLMAAKRREEELAKIEEERLALEARREEMKRKALEKQLEQKKKEAEKEKLLHSMEEDLKPVQDRTDLNKILQGMDEIAAGKEQEPLHSNSYTQSSAKNDMNDGQKTGKQKTVKDKYNTDLLEDKLVEDVLREFFA
jgi:hypothetical protein